MQCSRVDAFPPPGRVHLPPTVAAQPLFAAVNPTLRLGLFRCAANGCNERQIGSAGTADLKSLRHKRLVRTRDFRSKAVPESQIC